MISAIQQLRQRFGKRIASRRELSFVEQQALQTAAALHRTRNYQAVLLPAEETQAGIEQRILQEEFPERFVYVDLCSGTAVQNQAANAYPRRLAQSFPGSTIYCLDFDFTGSTVDPLLPHLHYLQGDLTSPSVLALLVEGTPPLYASGFNIPFDIGQQAIQWVITYQVRSFIGSMSGVEALDRRWEPSSRWLAERLSAKEVAMVNEHLYWMQELKSPFRHDYFAEDNARITAVKQVVTLDQALVLEEQGYTVRTLGKLHDPGPKNWSRADLFVHAKNNSR